LVNFNRCHQIDNAFRLSSSLLTLFLLCSCASTEDSSITTSQEQPQINGTIFATGEAYANSRDEAIEKALLNAVRKASGVFLSSELEVENERVLRNKLIQYSAGYIRGFEIIEEKKENTGVYMLINASISRSALVDFYAESYQEESVAIEGEQVYQSIKREVNRREERLSVLPQIFDTFPENAIIPKLVSQQSQYTDDRTLYIDIRWEISWSQTFFEALYQYAVEFSDTSCGMYRDPHYGWLPSSHACGQISFIGDNSSWWSTQYGTSYVFNDSTFTDALLGAVGNRGYYQQVGLEFEFLNAKGQIITSACADINLNTDADDVFMMMGGHRGFYTFHDRSLTGTVQVKITQPEIMKNIVKAKPKIINKC